MKRIFVLTICFFFVISCKGQEKEALSTKSDIQIKDDFKSANSFTLYKYNPNNPCNQSKAVSILKENYISECFDFIKTISGDEVSSIIDLIHNTKSYGSQDLACFDTEYSLVALSNNKIIGYINISFSCNKLISNPPIAERDSFVKNDIRNIGFSINGKNKLYKLLGLCNSSNGNGTD